ncbi:hypothetical protein [Streptomyces sp. HM190]|uniref:hypothetical protein n=1 Tax=Streptomyces sp. HM190 TaxID=2695266 RepID=UPI001356AD3A|nr:hypothetical protein [Streptomyces sp. HM190]
MTESETTAAATREPSGFPAAGAPAAVRTPGPRAAGTATEACGCGGEPVAPPRGRLPEVAAHTRVSPRAGTGASPR